MKLRVLIWGGLNWNIYKDFNKVELDTLIIDLLHLNIDHLLYWVFFFSITCIPDYQLNDVFREKYAKFSRTQEHCLCNINLPQNPTDFECFSTCIILGNRTLGPFWQTVLEKWAWNSEQERAVLLGNPLSGLCCHLKGIISHSGSIWHLATTKEIIWYVFCTMLLNWFSSQKPGEKS